MTTTATTDKKVPLFGSAADEYWGYKFGVDGLWELDDTSKFLANASRSTLDRLVSDRRIRKGRNGARVVFCVRSVRDHASSLEG